MWPDRDLNWPGGATAAKHCPLLGFSMTTAIISTWAQGQLLAHLCSMPRCTHKRYQLPAHLDSVPVCTPEGVPTSRRAHAAL